MPVVWTSTALADVEAIEDFIARASPSAAFRLGSNLISRTNRLLADHPLSGRQGRVDGTRELVVTGTAYIVVYRLSHDAEILAIVHGARRWPETFGQG